MADAVHETTLPFGLPIGGNWFFTLYYFGHSLCCVLQSEQVSSFQTDNCGLTLLNHFLKDGATYNITDCRDNSKFI